MSQPSIIARNISKTLTGEIPVTLIKDVSLEIFPGEFLVITGPSGSGKSSLLYLLGLLDNPSSGQIIINGTDTSIISEHELAAIRLSQLGFVFQFHFLLPEFSALENVMLPMQRLGKLSAAQAQQRASELLEFLGLGTQKHKLPKQLSGGQSQRVAIARALANEPKIVLADEPTGNLDSHSSENVESILRDLAITQNCTVVVVTHEQRIARSAQRRIVIVDGKVSPEIEA